MMELDDFKTVVSSYKALFFDAFGVLKNYRGLIPGIENTFKYLKENDHKFYILTNDSSRSPEQLAKSYEEAGLSEIVPDVIISSGMLAREFLQLKVKMGTIAYIGTEASSYYIDDLGLQLLPISQLDLKDIAEVNALVLLDDEGFDWRDDINKTINLLRKRNIPVIVANTDETYPISKTQVAIAIGGLSEMIEKIVGKRFIRFGKPDAQMFTFAYEHIRSTSGLPFEKKDILMVGDTLQTDILGGNKFGLDTVLVLTGNTLAEDVENRVRNTGIIPTYICESAVIE